MTIKDLSVQTGYSVGTVSRVLNSQPNVSEKARTAILEAAQRSGFQLNVNAKQLKQQHSNIILAVVKGTSNELFSQLVEALQRHMVQTGFPLVVDYMDEDSNEVLRALQLCREKKPRGILFLGGNYHHFLMDFDKIQIPCVLVTNDAADLPYPNLSSVSCNDRLAAQAAIDHLVALGHRKIAVVGGDRLVSDTARLRFWGCMDAFHAHQIPFDENQDYEGVRFSFADGYKAAQNLLYRGREFTAVFAMSDVMATGVIRALHDEGKQVPEDVSVMGFDGVSLGMYTIPRLSTVVQDVDALARQSITLLLDHIAGPEASRYETVPVHIQPRESTRKID